MKITFNGKVKRDQWECYAWTVNLNGQIFEYHTGLGHATESKNWNRPKTLTGKKTIKIDSYIYVHVPKIKDVLYSLAIDAQAWQDTFEDFCSNFAYDPDSRKALETYLKCQENGNKLLKALKSKNAVKRIIAWEL